MSVNPTELLKNAYGGTFEENVKTVLNKCFNSEIAENLWNQTCEKYSEFLQNHNNPEDDEDAVFTAAIKPCSQETIAVISQCDISGRKTLANDM